MSLPVSAVKWATVPSCAREFCGAEKVPFYTLEYVQNPLHAVQMGHKVWCTRLLEPFADFKAGYNNDRAYVRQNALKSQSSCFARVAGKCPLFFFKDLGEKIVQGDWKKRCQSVSSCALFDDFEDEETIFMKITGPQLEVNSAEQAGHLQIEKTFSNSKGSVFKTVNAIVKKSHLRAIQKDLVTFPLEDLLTSKSEKAMATIKLRESCTDEDRFNLAWKFQNAEISTCIRGKPLRIKWKKTIDANEVKLIREFDPLVALVIPDVKVNEGSDEDVMAPVGMELDTSKIVYQLKSVSLRAPAKFAECVAKLGLGCLLSRSTFLWSNVTFPKEQEAHVKKLIGKEVIPGIVLAALADESM